MSKLLLILAALPILFSCSRESSPGPWEPKTELNSREYKGGIFPVWITLKEPAREANVRWSAQSALIAYSKQGIDPAKNLIKADTAFLYWDTPPTPFLHIVRIDSARSDTTYYYRDTIFAIVDGVASLPIVIEVKNILPRIDSISVQKVSQPGDSLLTIAAHPGDIVEISISLKKDFNKANRPDVEMPREMEGLRQKSSNDSVWVYEWNVPNVSISDSSMYIKIKDYGGYGERLYKVHLVVYTESGSVWVASENELVKYTSTGIEVVRISDDFKYISDIAVNSNNGRLFVADKDGNTIYIYDTYGRQLSKNTSFKSPTAVAIDVVGMYAWVADENGLQRFKIENDALSSASLSYGSDKVGGPIEGLAIDQFQKDFVWFAAPLIDTVGLVIESNDPIIMSSVTPSWNRPSMVSIDPKNGIAWIADSSRIVAIDASGTTKARITEFGFVSSVSASAGGVWASDILKGKVCYFRQASDNTAMGGMVIPDEFLSPISVSALTSDGSVWIVDREAGRVVRYDINGNQIAYGTGLKLPRIGKTIQKVE
jgi:DNA-binding beta-propeller fold protein YncE